MSWADQFAWVWEMNLLFGLSCPFISQLVFIAFSVRQNFIFEGFVSRYNLVFWWHNEDKYYGIPCSCYKCPMSLHFHLHGLWRVKYHLWWSWFVGAVKVRDINIGHRLLKYIDYLMLNTQIRLINEYVYRVFSVVYGSAGIGRVRLNLLVH